MGEFRQNLEIDLRTSMENSWVSSAGCSHYLGLVGDCDTGAVHIHSTFGVRKPWTNFYKLVLFKSRANSKLNVITG